MSKVKRSYDVVAGGYDWLASLFIGKALRKAQTQFLPLIPPNAKILVVGGGTGWILEEITKVHQKGLYIDYVDVSANMIALSKKRYVSENEIHFYTQSILQFSGGQLYDVVITPFLLDNFKEETMQKVFAHLHQQLLLNGLWLYTDFEITPKSAWWQKMVLFTMYSFFRIVCNIEASQLPHVIAQFQKHQYHLLNSQTFLHHFIATYVYKKELQKNAS